MEYVATYSILFSPAQARAFSISIRVRAGILPESPVPPRKLTLDKCSKNVIVAHRKHSSIEKGTAMAYFKGVQTTLKKTSRTNRRRDTKTSRAQLRRRAEYRTALDRRLAKTPATHHHTLKGA